VARGAYVLRDADNAEVILIGTGSEVHVALEAQALLQEAGIMARVVSMPSWELFEAQEQGYRDAVLPPQIGARVVVEAAAPLGWERYVGRGGAMVGLERYGGSAPYQVLYEELGITVQRVAAAAREQLGDRR